MSTITTMQGLRDLPDGTTVDIQGAGTRRWVKQADCLTAGDMRLDLIAFEGQVLAGHLSVGSRFAVGDLYRTRGNDHYYIAGVYPDDIPTRRVLLGIITGGGRSIAFSRYGEDVNLGNATLLTGDDRPEWYPFCERMAAEYVRAEDLQQQVSDQAGGSEVADLRTRVADLTRQRDQSQTQLSNLVAALEEWAREHDIEDDVDDNGDLRDLFNDYSITWQGMESVTVTVNIDGETFTDFEDAVGGNSAVEEIINPSRLGDWNNTSVSEVTLEWSATFDTDIEVEDGTCACDEVDRDRVRQWLDDNGFNYSEFAFTTDCENC